MRVFVILTALTGLLCLTGCTGETNIPSGSVVKVLSEVGGAQLRTDAQTVALRITVSNSEALGPIIIPDTLLTDSIRKFGPKQVSLGSDNLKIVTSESSRYRNGIQVYFPSYSDSSYEKGAFLGGGSGQGVTKLEDGIHWFWEKKRSDALLRQHWEQLEKQKKMSPNQVPENIGTNAPTSQH